ncbi:hypothetical protein D3C75_1163910 [compost metagenome]
MAVCDGAEKCGPLSTIRRAECGIFDIAAMMNMTVLIQQCCPDTETGVRNIGIGPCFDRFL